MKVPQTDPGIHLQTNQKHHHQPERLPHRQEDHAQTKEVDPNKDDSGPHPQNPNHRPDN